MYTRNLSFQQPWISLWKLSMCRRNGTLSTTKLKTLLFSYNKRLVSLSKVSKYLVLILNSADVCRLEKRRRSQRSIDRHFRLSLFFILSGSLLARRGVWSTIRVGSACSFSNFLSWPLDFQLTVLQWLLGLFSAIVRISFWSTKLNWRFVAARDKFLVGGQNVAAAQNSQRHRNIAAWNSSFMPVWFNRGFDWLIVSSKHLVARAY